MTVRTRIVAVLVLAVVGLGIETPPAAAQWGDSDGASESYRMPPGRRSRYGEERAPRRYAPLPQQETRQFYWPWEDRPQPPQALPEPDLRGHGRSPRQRVPTVSGDGVPRRVRRTPLPPATATTKPAEPAVKSEAKIQVAVFGDTLASYLSKGLDTAFAENPNVEIVDKSRGDSGLVRKDVVDWPKVVEEYLKAVPKTGYAVFMVGVNDRQALRDNNESYEALSDKWRELYVARLDALIKVFVDQRIPLIWVDIPPVRFESMSTDLAAINDIARERVLKAGQTYVDVWPGFVDDRNRFTATGPDLDGQQAKLRTPDGIHFTSAGSRKVAHFVDVELKRLMSVNGTIPIEQPASIAAVPSGPAKDGEPIGLDDTAAIDRKITAMLPSLPEPPGIPSLPVKPTAGPVVPLGRLEASPGGTLLNGRPRDGDTMGLRERTMSRGLAPVTQPGRADDFRWPPS